MNRGVVALPGIINSFGDGFEMERSINSQELAYYVLYWDRVVIPGTNMVYKGIPEEDLLIKSGVIERPRVQFNGSFSGSQITDSFGMAQAMVAEKLIKEDKTSDWVLHQVGGNIKIPPQFSKKNQSIRLDLINALPVPVGNVYFEEILSFKQKRHSELLHLHAALDELYIDVLKSPDSDLSLRKAISDLKVAVTNIQRVSGEKWVINKNFDFAVELNIDSSLIIDRAFRGALVDAFTNGFSMPLATIGSILSSVVKVKATKTYAFSPASNNQKLSYLASARNAGVIPRL